LVEDANTISRNTEGLLEANSDDCLEVYTQESKYVIVSRHQNTGENHDLLVANKFFETVSQISNFWEQQ
jgi:hypothetical protein